MRLLFLLASYLCLCSGTGDDEEAFFSSHALQA